MYKINKYLFNLTNKYLIINFLIISFFIIFINLLELSRVISEENKTFINFFYLSFLRYPAILNEIIPFVTIISVAFLIRNLINNNELVSMRNLGYSIFDIFIPISIAIFLMGLFFLFFVNPISVFMAKEYDKKINNKDESLLPVSTYIVDKMYKAKYPTGSRTPKNKDEKTISNFKNITNDFLIGMKKLIEYSSKQNVKFFDMVDETTFENLEEIKMFLNSEDYQNIRTFSVEYQVDFNGKLEKAINQ